MQALLREKREREAAEAEARQRQRAEKEQMKAEAERELQAQKKAKRSANVDHPATIARLSTELLTDPEKLMGTRLIPLLDYASNPPNEEARKLALVSLVAVFLDLLPGYRIMEHEAKFLADGRALKKETRELWTHEQQLLGCYQRFLKCLFRLIRVEEGAAAADFDPTSTYVVALRCACQLFTRLAHFNYFDQLATCVVRVSALRGYPGELAVQAVHDLFLSDRLSDATIEVTHLICKEVKQRNYRAQPHLLEPFLRFHFSEQIKGLDPHRGASLSKHRRRKLREGRIDRVMKKAARAASAELDEEDQEAKQSEILRSIFVCYFRVLKRSTNSPLLPTVLLGIGRYAHFINVNFLVDLLECLKETAAAADLPLATCFQCVTIAVQIAQSFGDTVSLDLRSFFNRLFVLMPGLVSNATDESTLALVECIELLFSDTRVKANLDRLAAFIKRLTLLSTSCPAASHAVALLTCAHKLLHKHPAVEQLLDPEHPCAGTYDPFVDDPEHSNAMATTLWELGSPLACHWHPFVASYAKAIANPDTPPTAQSAVDLLKAYDASRGGFNPPVQPPIIHPHRKRLQARAKKTAEQGSAMPPLDVYITVQKQYPLTVAAPPEQDVARPVFSDFFLHATAPNAKQYFERQRLAALCARIPKSNK